MTGIMWKQTTTKPVRRTGQVSFSGVTTMPVSRLVILLVCLSPLLLVLNWVLGTTLLWVLFVASLNSFCWRRPSGTEWSLIGVSLLLTLGLVVGQLSGLRADRVMSSIYHLIHWFILIAYLNIGRSMVGQQRDNAFFMRLMHTSFICFCIMVVYMFLAALYVSSAPLEAIKFPTLIIGRFAAQLDMLSGFTTISVSKINSIRDGFEWRLIGFGMWTSEGAYLAAIIGLFSTIHVYSKYGIKALIVVELCAISIIFLIGSRTSIAAYLLSVLVWFALVGRHWKTIATLAAPALLAGVVVFFTYGIDFITTGFNQANEFREASSSTRFTSYWQALKMTIDHNPFTGLGYTPDNPSLLGIPIGSHSSWTSILIRGGFLAVVMFMVVYAKLLAKVVKAIARISARSQASSLSDILPVLTLSRCVIITLLWWITEDLDGPAAAASFAGLTIGLFLGLLRLDRGAAPEAMSNRLLQPIQEK